MSQENIEMVRALLSAFDRADYEAALEALDSEIEWQVPPGTAIGREVYRGRDEAQRGFAEWLAAWTTHRFEPKEMLDHGEHVVVGGMQIGRGRGSGVEVRCRPSTSSHCVRGRSLAIAATGTIPKPSKAWGCGSRRCRRRTRFPAAGGRGSRASTAAVASVLLAGGADAEVRPRLPPIRIHPQDAVGVVQLTKGIHVARVPRLEGGPHDLDVLLRHRLLPQPGGFEGFGLTAAVAPPNDPTVPPLG